MIKAKINGKPKDFPSSWPDVTTQNYVGLLNCNSRAQVLSLFSGIPEETLLKAQIIGLDKILTVLEFTKDVPTFERTAKVGPYTMPKDITFESLAQFEDLRSLAKKITESDAAGLIDLYVTACAIYCQKLRDKEYDYSKALEMKPEIYSYPCPEVIGNGAFFIIRPWNLSSNTTKTSQTTRRQSKKTRRVSRS